MFQLFIVLSTQASQCTKLEMNTIFNTIILLRALSHKACTKPEGNSLPLELYLWEASLRPTNLESSLELFDFSLQGLGGRVSWGGYGSALAGALCVYRCWWRWWGLLRESDLPPLPQLHLQNLFLLLHTGQVGGQLLQIDRQTQLVGYGLLLMIAGERIQVFPNSDGRYDTDIAKPSFLSCPVQKCITVLKFSNLQKSYMNKIKAETT